MSNFWYNFVKVTGGIPALLWMRAKPMYLDENGKFVHIRKMPHFKKAMLCANHNSPTNPILIQCVFWYKTVNSLATTELFSSRLATFFFKSVKCIPVDKENFGMASFHAVCECLKNDEAVLIFPEGKLNTSATKEVSPLKSGVVLMAHRTSAPIIPMYIVPIKKWYQRRVLLVGRPIYSNEICNGRASMADIEAITKLLHEREEELRICYEAEHAK